MPHHYKVILEKDLYYYIEKETPGSGWVKLDGIPHLTKELATKAIYRDLLDNEALPVTVDTLYFNTP